MVMTFLSQKSFIAKTFCLFSCQQLYNEHPQYGQCYKIIKGCRDWQSCLSSRGLQSSRQSRHEEIITIQADPGNMEFVLGPHAVQRQEGLTLVDRRETGGVWEIDMSRVSILNSNFPVDTVEKGIPGREKCAMIQRKEVCVCAHVCVCKPIILLVLLLM